MTDNLHKASHHKSSLVFGEPYPALETRLVIQGPNLQRIL